MKIWEIDHGGIDAIEYVVEGIDVAFQTYALRAVQDLNRIRASHGKPKKDKLHCYSCDSIKLKGVTRIEIVNAVANYFKHHHEWSRWPISKDEGVHDTQILERFGITEKTVHRCCIEATTLLCGTGWKMIVLHQIVREWRAHLINELG